jgi:hypothetical protein
MYNLEVLNFASPKWAYMFKSLFKLKNDCGRAESGGGG